MRLVTKVFQIFDHVGLKAIGSIGGEVEYFIKSLYFSLVCALKNVNTSNSICVGCDPQGLLSAWIVSSLRKNKLIYWSFELWINRDIKRLSKKIIKKIEKICNKNANVTIDFGDQRCEIIKNENNLDSRKMFSLPNSPLGKPVLKRNTFFNEKFNIPFNKHILLYAGGVGEVYGLDRLLRNLDKIPPSCVVVIHCRSYDRNIEKLTKSCQRYINDKVFFSTEPVPYESLEIIYSSCDIGLNLWPAINTNLKYPGLSSGKLFWYLKFGVPIIVNELPGMKEFVENPRIGYCIDDFSLMGKLVELILHDFNEIKNNCIKVASLYNFSVFHDKLIEKIDRN